MKKLLTLFIIFLFPLSTSAAITDAMINPYTTVGNTLRIEKMSTLRQAGKTSVIVDKTKPKISLSKWNGEVSLGVTYTGIQAAGNRPLFSKNVEWSQGTQTMEAVPLEATTTMEDGGMEININLAAKPASNVFTFQLDTYQNLDFYYQAPLWQEVGLKKATLNCTDTLCGGSERPENIVGSYAVYYKNHKDHIEGQTNYATGKAYHIFRPLVTDAKGNTVWATLSYANGVLTVTVPQNFLNTAIYPVVVDPTFGYTTIGGTTGGSFLGNAVGSLFSLPTNASVTLVSFQVSANTNRTWGAIYTNAGASSALIAQSVVNSNNTSGWRDHTVTTSLTGGNSYWLLGTDNCDSVTGKYDTGATGQGVVLSSGAGSGCGATFTWPGTLNNSGLNLSSRMYSIYATYTAAASPAGPPSTTLSGQMTVTGQLRIN